MNASKRTESLKTWYNKVMTFFDNLKNKLFKEENGKRVKNDQSVGKSKDFQDKIKGLFAKKPDEVEQAVEDLEKIKKPHVINVLSKRNLLIQASPWVRFRLS